jgi:hypothetical protein
MGRFEKLIIDNSGIDKRETGYYSTPDFIAVFMASTLLKLNPNGKSVFDPCVGREELIKGFYRKNIDVDGMDIINHGDYFHCNFIENDFIEFYKEKKSEVLLSNKISLKYDYYIANPPYNCHEVDYIKNNKKTLKKVFGKVGVYNMYSMFISAMIDCAKEDSLMAIISADSFLTATAHNKLRQQIMDECAIHYLVLCPTDLFWDQKADVRTCIMILQKGKHNQGTVRTLNRPSNKSELQVQIQNELFDEVEINTLINRSSKDSFEFVVDIPAEIKDLFNCPKVGEKYKCVTGISTGADNKYISKEKKEGFEVPFYKNPGSRKFYSPPDGYLTNDYLKLDKEIDNFMVRNKSLLLREGITCSSMGLPFSACYLPKGSTFGVNANIFCDKEDIWWLMSYLNSSLVTYLIRGVLIRSNMITSGYVSKLPVIELNEETKEELSKIALDAYEAKVTPEGVTMIINKIDELVFNNIQLPDSIKEEILHFASNLQLRV